MCSVTKQNAIDRPCLELVSTLDFVTNEAFAAKDMKVTKLGGTTMHQPVACLLLVDSKINHVRQ
jgi:hypothetical protein